MSCSARLVDPFGRTINYLRLSLTDRCNLRCIYCLPERASFGARADQLSIEELDRLASAFIRLGIRKLRLTGGEPLVRKGALELVERLGRHLSDGLLEELTLTTNGILLRQSASALAAAGVRRINVSIDHLDPIEFARITRGGDLAEVLAGIAAARSAGLEVKINTVVLKNDNLPAIPDLVAWAFDEGMTITLIEVMPIGEIGIDRFDQHVPMPAVRDVLEERWRLSDVNDRTAGPARYAVNETGGRIGFITPLSSMFCEGCNRIRVGSDGMLHACLGRDVATDLKAPLRAYADDAALDQAIRSMIEIKPKSHDFNVEPGSHAAVRRPMAATGG